MNELSKYFNGQLVKQQQLDNVLIESCIQAVQNYQQAMDAYQISAGLNIILKLCNKANKYIEENKPWELEKNEKMEQLYETLASLVYTIIVSAFLLQPVLVDNAQKIADYFNVNLTDLTFETILTQEIIYNKTIEKKENLFNRVNVEQELKQIETELN